MNKLDELLSYSFEEIKGNGHLIIKLLQLSQDFLNLSYTDCEKQHREYYEKLKTIKNKPMAQQKDYLDKKYILKPGKVLYYNHTHFNNDTLTDKMAANAIKRFPALAGAFLSEKERAILEAKAAGAHNITEAKDSLADEQFENEIVALIIAEEFDEARVLSAKLLVKENREAALKAIEEAEAKKLADEAKAKEEAKEAEAKKLADEAKAKEEAKEAEAEKAKKKSNGE